MLRGMAGHGLVDGVVHDLPDEVVQATDVGRADVHAGSAPHRIQALEDLDGVRGVRTRLGGGARSTSGRSSSRGSGALGRGLIGHAVPPVIGRCAVSRSTRRPRSSSSYQVMVMRPPVRPGRDGHLRAQGLAHLGLHVPGHRDPRARDSRSGSRRHPVRAVATRASVWRTESARVTTVASSASCWAWSVEPGQCPGVAGAEGAIHDRLLDSRATSQGYATYWRRGPRATHPLRPRAPASGRRHR